MHSGSSYLHDIYSNANVMSNIFLKFLFYTCVVLQVILWPTMISIIFASVIALEGIISYAMSPREQIWDRISDWGICFLHTKKDQLRNYVFSSFIGLYMAVFFMQFWIHESSMQPRMTTWIHPSKLRNYSFTTSKNNPLPGVDVTSDISKDMRSNPFSWPKEHTDYAVRLNGSLPYAGPNKQHLQCTTEAPNSQNMSSGTGSTSIKYACYSSKLAIFKPENEDAWGSAPRVVPMPSQFYFTDVMIIPAPGTLCKDLEVYRIIVDSSSNVDSGLDYPSSTSINPSSASLYLHCSLFGDSSWCLHNHHTFTVEQYKKRVEEKCLQGRNTLEFRLPLRSLDIDPGTGQSSLDTLLVSRGTLVKLKFSWSAIEEETNDMYTLNSKYTLTTWSSWFTSNSDSVQSWRTSTESFAVFVKFAVVSTPLFIVWYYLTAQFSSVFHSNENSQIIVLCIFVLLPSILLFLSIGAWLPMVGSIICGIVINHTPVSAHDKNPSKWRAYLRPTLFFLTASCNSIQFAWLMALVGQAGWSAFFFDFSLKQLGDLSSHFIVSDTVSSNWISLMLPSVILLNLSFLIGSAICIVLEILHYWGHFQTTRANI